MRSYKTVPAGLIAGCVALSLFTSAALAAVKQYQVTGKLVTVTEKMLVIDKGDEKWEIERTSDLKTSGKLEVGEKVTIYYHMVANSVDKK